MPGKVLQCCLHILSSWCRQEGNRIGIQTHDSWNKVQKHDILTGNLKWKIANRKITKEIPQGCKVSKEHNCTDKVPMPLPWQTAEKRSINSKIRKTRIKAWTGLIACKGQEILAQGKRQHRLCVHTPEVGGNRWGQAGQDTQSDRG